MRVIAGVVSAATLLVGLLLVWLLRCPWHVRRHALGGQSATRVDGVNVALDRCFFVGENSERDMTTFAYSFCIAIYGGKNTLESR